MRLAALLIASLLSLVPVTCAGAADVSVAVASNFRETLLKLQPLFEEASGHRLIISAGSTGLLYAQIRQGAPFEVLLAADRETPAALAAAGLVTTDNIATYAQGRLALVSRTCPNGVAQLPVRESPVRIAIANPRVAPYGRAASAALARLHQDASSPPQIAQATNVAAAYAVFVSGAVDAALVANSLLVNAPASSCRASEIPAQWHPPLDQDVALLKRAEQNPAARAFLEFLLSAPAQRLIAQNGYGTQSP